MRVATIKARVNVIHMESSHEETKPMDSPISFPSVNPNRSIVPHYDALMLTLYINSFDVHKVLVDPVSATYLLQLPTFKQMKFSLGLLNSVGESSLVSTVTLGDVALLVKVGPITQQVLFLIVEDLEPYNAIKGRAWLYSMNVVPSTYHQMISYLTNVGQVDLLSSQLAARQCYQLSIQEQRGEKNSENPPLDDQTPA